MIWVKIIEGRKNEVVIRAIGLGALLACAAVVASSASAQASKVPRRPCDIGIRFGSPLEGPPGQWRVDIVVRNKGRTCRVFGNPNVELIGPTRRVFGSLYQIPYQHGRKQVVVLRHGARAHARLTWLRDNTWGGWVPAYIRIVISTNHGQSLPIATPWQYGAVLRQDGATHPGTYVDPIRPGGR